jgi:hypothetical protein
MVRVLRSIRGLSAEQAGEALGRAGIEPSARPEVVAPGEFAALFQLVRGTE